MPVTLPPPPPTASVRILPTVAAASLKVNLQASSQAAPQEQTRTPLQKHVDFFDRNSDGLTTVPETYAGLRALGMGVAPAAGASVVINAGLAHKTGAPWYSLTVHNDQIAASKHDSDTDVYDAQGNFDAGKFEQMWEKNDSNHDGWLSGTEIQGMLDRNAETKAGKVAASAEFKLLNQLAGQPGPDGTRSLSRERMEKLYDGTLFYQIANERASQG